MLLALNLRIVCRNFGVSINKKGYDHFKSDYFVSILMWMLILNCWMMHKMIAERKLILINTSGFEG